MEERRQPPILQKMTGCLLSVLQVIELPIGLLKEGIGFIDGQPQGKDIHGMGIVVPVLHQKAAAVGFKFREEFDHPSRLLIIPHEHLQIAEIDVEGVLFSAGLQESVHRIFQTKSVNVFFHIVGNLVGLQAGALKIKIPVTDIRSFMGVKAKPLTILPYKCQRRLFQAVLCIIPGYGLVPQHCICHMNLHSFPNLTNETSGFP